MDKKDRLEFAVFRHVLNLTYLVDNSGGMSGERINQLNLAMPLAFDAAEKAAKNFEADLRIRVIKIGSVSEFILETSPEKGLNHIDWVELNANSGGMDTAGALRLTRDIMHIKNLVDISTRPIVILISSRASDDPDSTRKAVDELKESFVVRYPENIKIIRIAVGGRNPVNKRDKIIRIAVGIQDAYRPELEYFASKGVITDEYGNEKRDVPLVFDVNKIDDLSAILQKVTLDSIATACNNGTRRIEEMDIENDSTGAVVSVVINGDDCDCDWEE